MVRSSADADKGGGSNPCMEDHPFAHNSNLGRIVEKKMRIISSLCGSEYPNLINFEILDLEKWQIDLKRFLDDHPPFRSQLL
jgi:hypothetical protein